MVTTRRNLLALLAAALVRPQNLFANSQSANQPETAGRIELGAQTNAWPIDTKNLGSFLGVLRQIRTVGYGGFETGYFNLMNHADKATEVRRRIADTGLAFFGLHVAIPYLKTDPRTLLPPETLYTQIGQAAIAFGAQNLILSGTPAKSTEEAKLKAAALVHAAEFGASIGIPFLYHNHEGEFTPEIGEMEILFNETEHTKVKFLLDAGHAYRGGSDVIQLINRRLPRIAAFHMRDYVDGKQVPLGQGTFPLAEFVSTLISHQWSGWILNEEDSDGKQKLGLAVIEPAYSSLRRALLQRPGHQ